MIKFRLKELMAEKERVEGRRITFRVVQAETGISANTLVRIGKQNMKQIGVGTMSRLLEYFDCGAGDLIVRD